MAKAYSGLSVEADTAERLRNMRDERGVTMDELLESLLEKAEETEV